MQAHYVKSAAKDYPHAGIQKGEPYWWWKPWRMAKQMSKTRPKPSQLASSDFARGVLAAVEALEAWSGPWTESDRDDLVGEMEELRDAEQEKFDNLPEGLQQGDTGVMLEDRVAMLDDWSGELESLQFPAEGEELEEGEETPLEQALASAPSV